MQELKTEFLFTLELNIKPPLLIGQGPSGMRVMAPVVGGRFEGLKLKGSVLDAGGDWVVVTAHGTSHVDVRVVLQTDDGHLISMTYSGRVRVPAELSAKVMDPDQVESVDPSEYYMRSNPLFETAIAGPYSWLNDIVSIGVGRLRNGSVAYDIYAVV